jgi:hypothetical protein
MTLSELATVSAPVYELRVRSDQKREWLTLPIGSDLSDHPESYNMFAVDIDLLGFDFGDYEYQAKKRLSKSAKCATIVRLLNLTNSPTQMKIILFTPHHNEQKKKYK